MDHDAEHFDALHQTGYFGKMAAGCIFMTRDTGRILLSHRSGQVLQPNTWGSWGGAVNSGETPEQAVRREVSEEAGYHGHYDLQPLYVYRDGSFSYHNFLVLVDHEFTPTFEGDSAWETQGFRWCEWGDWPSPLHFGLVALFNDPASVKKIQDDLAAIQGTAK